MFVCKENEEQSGQIDVKNTQDILYRLCSKKNYRGPSAPNLWNPGYPAYDLYKKSKIF